ncbi:Glycolate dehydrogenase, iron-sulfur subunit GlcF [Nitrincola lacisaponensis]|uniref:Glycolate oxidase iron-sulfur subunit n=1 Tax=Nitrincola lacisaponensis TaxID=267850 RepID=A0A063Y3N7_9GAMM|nr:glycolate oxidase subunit GlcF [Nitrincola lacisaponensis]KDE40913.1 Glycolate dehydrogenase, iron-sulfur subunit GlcF [Nitrincola lacisaponensis]
MQTNLSDEAQKLPRAEEAAAILRSCVHCGFCTATCPTYQLLGDELDGPRGRIYLMKSFFEGGEVTRETQAHLDRCLTCRNCETTCPSGVQYHTLLDIGRAAIEEKVGRPFSETLVRNTLRKVLPTPQIFDPLLKTGQLLRPVLPKSLKQKIPADSIKAKPRPSQTHARKMLILEGCVQPSLSPNTNAATARILDKLGIQVISATEAGCCGAVDYHLNAHETGLQRARRNIDAWWSMIESGAEAIIQTASGCGAFVKEYADLLKDDPDYADKAEVISRLSQDLVEILAREDLSQLTLNASQTLAFHCPCTLQHALKLNGAVEQVLRKLGFSLTQVPNAHLCCGSAGTYSVTQPELSMQLRDNKLDALESGKPDIIATANIGCQTHLNGAGRTHVRHWIEIVEEALTQ